MMVKNIKEVTDRDFAEIVLGAELPVLVEFGAAWCPPCRLMLPVIESLADKYGGAVQFFTVDVDVNTVVTQRYGIKGIPTMIIFEDGEEKERIVGAASKEALSHLIDRYAVGVRV